MDNYELNLSYNPERDSLEKSLIFLTKIVGGQSAADEILADALGDPEIVTKLILTDIKYGSLRLFISNIVKNTKDKEIQDKGIKAYYHQFLIEVKKPFLNYASEHKTIDKIEDLRSLRSEAAKIAQENEISPLLIESLSEEVILDYLSGYSVPPDTLGKEQSYKAICGGTEYKIDRDFNITANRKAEILSGEEKVFEDQELFLRPKTLCYEGESMWEFHTQKGHTIRAKITDVIWLKKFQSNDLPTAEFPFPGRILKVIADISIIFDQNNFRKGQQVVVKKVLGIADPLDIPQISFDHF